MIAQPFRNMDVSSWQNLLEEHHTLLNNHLDTVTLMRHNIGDDTSGAQMIQSCVQQTEAILQTFKMSAYKFMGELQSRNQPQPAPTNGVLMSTVNGGVNGPTPAEQVLQNSGIRKAAIRTKRKAPAEQPTPVAAASSPTSGGLRKRARTAARSRSGTATPRSRQTRSTASPQPLRPTVEDDDGGDDHSFLRAVEAKLKEKEEKAWKGMMKKRKRSSDASDTVVEEQTRRPKATPKPRKKTRQTLTQVEGDVIIEPAYTPQQEKQPSKRSSPATEYMESILRRGDTKRQRTTKRSGILAG